MMLWIAFAVMTAAAALFVLYPLSGRRTTAGSGALHDIIVYKDQLAELERDLEAGLIPPAEAKAARVEISRRLLKADAEALMRETSSRSLAGVTATVAIMALPLMTVGLYLQLGAPELPDLPLSTRQEDLPRPADVAAMVRRVEEHLKENPQDAEGWRVLAPIYMTLRRPAEAAAAWKKVIDLEGSTPELLERYGEALLSANAGIVKPEAQAAFDAAVAADGNRIKARFYRAMGLAQAGRTTDAVREYDEIIRRSPEGAAWLETVRGDRKAALAAAGLAEDTPEPKPAEALPGPDLAAVEAASQLSPSERGQMIEQMVAGLAARLEQEPHDSEGWVRLIRAYGVLGRAEDARLAYQQATSAFANDAAILAQLQAVAGEAGVAPDESTGQMK